MKEKQLIQRIRRSASRADKSAGRGIGDDCAVLRLPPGHEALVTTDFSLENIHFRREWHPADAVGHRCLARGLSDIAAMGGVPRSAFLSLALPADLPQRWVDGFISGLLKLARRYSVTLAGGIPPSLPGKSWPTSLSWAQCRKERPFCALEHVQETSFTSPAPWEPRLGP